MKESIRILRSAVTAVLLAYVPFAGSGCNNSGTATFNPPVIDPNSCVWNGQYLKGSIGASCCRAGQPIVGNAPPGCPSPDPADTAIKTTMSLFSGAANSGNTALGSATSLVGTNGANQTGGQSPNTYAALAGPGSVDLTRAKGPVMTVGVASSPLKSLSSGAAGAGSSGSGATGTRGGALGAADTAASDSTPLLSSVSGGKSGDGATGGYVSGGGTSGGGGGRGVASVGGEQGSFGMDFGDSRERASVTPGSEDPDDYFGRLVAGDNLFKVVEKRYRHKSKQWALGDLERQRGQASVSAQPAHDLLMK